MVDPILPCWLDTGVAKSGEARVDQGCVRRAAIYLGDRDGKVPFLPAVWDWRIAEEREDVAGERGGANYRGRDLCLSHLPRFQSAGEMVYVEA